jgi:hypothetical protein
MLSAAAVGHLMELGGTDPVPTLEAPAVTHQLQQILWPGPQAGEVEVDSANELAFSGAGGNYPHVSIGANPGLTNLLWSLF